MADDEGLTTLLGETSLETCDTALRAEDESPNRLTEKTHEKFALEIITFCHHGWVPDAADAVGGGFGFSGGQCR